MLYNPKFDLDEAAKLLLGAASQIEQFGWAQGVLHKSNGAHCLLGAISVQLTELVEQDAKSRSELGKEATQRLLDFLQVPSLARWNDEICRNQAQAVAALRAAAWNKS